MSEPHGYMKWVVFGSAAVIAVGAGYMAYKYLLLDGDDDEVKPSAPLSDKKPVAGGGPSLPSRSAPAAKKVTPKVSGPPKTCAHCDKALSRLPLRCSKCKSAYYCSPDCQKAGWASHKEGCKASAADQKPASEAPSQREESAEDKPRTMEEALAQMLEETSGSKGETLEGMFEKAVMLFLRGDYRQALSMLKDVQTKARSSGEKAMEGETYKWMGHCHVKLEEPAKAEVQFQEGVEFSKVEKQLKLHIDCLSGLGILHRSMNEAEKAVVLLKEALDLCEASGDLDSAASTLVNMGSALMSIDQEEGVKCLTQAVALREAAMERCHAMGDHGALATAVMEHANATVNLAGALYVMKRFEEAKMGFLRCLEVFELLEDVDKVSKVLVNLANMTGIQMKENEYARKEAAAFRARLVAFLAEKDLRTPSTDEPCAICMEPLNLLSPSAAGKEVLVLACLHCFHDECWNTWSQSEAEGGGSHACCATCKKPVVLHA